MKLLSGFRVSGCRASSWLGGFLGLGYLDLGVWGFKASGFRAFRVYGFRVSVFGFPWFRVSVFRVFGFRARGFKASGHMSGINFNMLLATWPQAVRSEITSQTSRSNSASEWVSDRLQRQPAEMYIRPPKRQISPSRTWECVFANAAQPPPVYTF